MSIRAAFYAAFFMVLPIADQYIIRYLLMIT